MVTGARKNKTLISPPTIADLHLLFWICLPKFACFFFLWISSNCDVVNTTFKLNHLKLKHFKLYALLATTVGNPPGCDLGGLHLFFLVLVATNDPFGCDLDHGFPPPFSWLQLPMIFLVVILVVLVLFFLCL